MRFLVRISKRSLPLNLFITLFCGRERAHRRIFTRANRNYYNRPTDRPKD